MAAGGCVQATMGLVSSAETRVRHLLIRVCFISEGDLAWQPKTIFGSRVPPSQSTDLARGTQGGCSPTLRAVRPVRSARLTTGTVRGLIISVPAAPMRGHHGIASPPRHERANPPFSFESCRPSWRRLTHYLSYTGEQVEQIIPRTDYDQMSLVVWPNELALACKAACMGRIPLESPGQTINSAPGRAGRLLRWTAEARI